MVWMPSSEGSYNAQKARPVSPWPLLGLIALGAAAGIAASEAILHLLDAGSTVLHPYLTFFGAFTGGMVGGFAGAFRLVDLSRESPAWARWGWFLLPCSACGAIGGATLWLFTWRLAVAAGC
jgi:hypothetical protein